MLLPHMVFDALRRRYRERRLVEIDGSKLIRSYGVQAAERALQYAAQGSAYLTEGRRPGHWTRVARCIAGRPDPIRSERVFG